MIPQHNAPHCKRFLFNKNVTEKVGNARACAMYFSEFTASPQMRRAGGISVRLRNPNSRKHATAIVQTRNSSLPQSNLSILYYVIHRQQLSIFLPRAAMHKCGLCRRAVSVCPTACLSVCHVRVFCRNE